MQSELANTGSWTATRRHRDEAGDVNMLNGKIIAATESLNGEEWNQVLECFADANIYQTRSYGAACWRESQLSHLVLREAGEPVAAAQVRIVQVPGLRRGVAYVRWGPLWRPRNHPVDPRGLRLMLDALVAEYVQRRKLLLRILPNIFRGEEFGAAAEQAATEAGFVPGKDEAYRTIRLNLSPSLVELRKALDGKWRNKLNGAEKNGLAITEGTGDDLYADFLGAYREMMSRKQFDTTVDAEQFGRMQQTLPDRLKMQIFLSRKDGKTLNALVVSLVGDTGIYLLGATSDEGTKTKGAYLLQWRAIQWLKERGALWYDLGGINPEFNPGVYEFKKGFSGQDATFLPSWECRKNALSRLIVNTAESCVALRKKWRARNGAVRPPAGARSGVPAGEKPKDEELIKPQNSASL